MRTGFLGLVLMMSCAAAASPRVHASPQAPNDAEALFKKMEAALAGANFKIAFTSAVTHPASPQAQMKGTLAVETTNAADLEVSGKVGTRTFTLKLTAAKDQITMARSETPPPPDLGPLPPPVAVAAPPSLSKNLAAAMARGGFWLAQEYFDGEYRVAADRHFKGLMGIPVPPPGKETDVTTWIELRNFTLDKKEKVAGRDAQAVKYDMIRAGETLGILTTVTVWIDVETSKPLKREGRVCTTQKRTTGGKEETVPTHVSTWLETYE